MADVLSPLDLYWYDENELPELHCTVPRRPYQEEEIDMLLDITSYSPEKHQQQLSPHSVLENLSPVEEPDTESELELSLQEQELLGCRILHLLLAGAEAVFTRSPDLTRVILLRLRQLARCTSARPVFHRLAFYFTEGLHAVLEGMRPNKSVSTTYLDRITAFQALHEATPYVKFGHYIANQALLEAVEGERRIHIIDYDSPLGIQWPPLMQALSVRNGGPPHVRLTVIHHANHHNHLGTLQEIKERLTDCAAAYGVPFTLHQARLEDHLESRILGLKIVKGEVLLVNCMLHLLHTPHHSFASVLSFIKCIRKLSPRLMTFVEETVTGCAGNTMDRFFHALHHYSAMLDSLEASLCDTRAHILVERTFVATRIRTALVSLVANAHANQDQPWSRCLENLEFQPVCVSPRNTCQARLLLGLFKDGYRLEEDGNQSLMLSWESRTMMAASVWTCTSSDTEENLAKND